MENIHHIELNDCINFKSVLKSPKNFKNWEIRNFFYFYKIKINLIKKKIQNLSLVYIQTCLRPSAIKFSELKVQKITLNIVKKPKTYKKKKKC